MAGLECLRQTLVWQLWVSAALSKQSGEKKSLCSLWRWAENISDNTADKFNYPPAYTKGNFAVVDEKEVARSRRGKATINLRDIPVVLHQIFLRPAPSALILPFYSLLSFFFIIFTQLAYSWFSTLLRPRTNRRHSSVPRACEVLIGFLFFFYHFNLFSPTSTLRYFTRALFGCVMCLIRNFTNALSEKNADK